MKPGDDQGDFATELAAFEACLAESRAAPLEEAVPAEMMQVFTDEQWPQLLFEFQPSMRMFTATRDIVGWSRSRDQGDRPPAPERGEEIAWLVFRQAGEQLVRPLADPERQAITLARSGENFAAMAMHLWPEQDAGSAHHRMTELLLRWLDEGLVIDAGVPLPPDAEYAE